MADDPDRPAKNFKKPVVSRSSSSSSASSPSSSDDEEPQHSSTRLPPASAPVVPRPPAERPALTPPLPPGVLTDFDVNVKEVSTVNNFYQSGF